MRIYLASRYGRREELCECRDVLERMGHVVTSRWLSGNHAIGGMDAPPDGDNGELSDQAIENRKRFAEEDIDDILSSDLLIAFTEPVGSVHMRGGRHVELGIAIGRFIDVLIIGHRENIFCWLPENHFASSFDEAIRLPLLADAQP